MTATINTQVGHGHLVIDLVGSALTNDMGNVLNPEGVACVITGAMLYVEHAGVATSDLHIGIGAASTGVAQNDVGDNVPVDLTAGHVQNLVHPTAANTELTVPAIWHATDYLTFFVDTALSTGFIGKLFVDYIRLTD